jgi:DNA-binding helix-hairpin-helix protein with protein kinase domain
VNESNILVSDTALVTLVDTDSFQVREPDSGVVYRCPVGSRNLPLNSKVRVSEIDRVPEHDLFGLAVLIFQLLMEGTHPFSGIYQGIGDPPPYEARIKAGHFSYSLTRKVPYRPTPIAPAWEILHPSLRKLFQDCFESGHNNPQLRPNAQTWQSALNEAENALVTCAANNHHRYGNHLKTCPWCERTLALGGRDPFPSSHAVQTRQHLQPIKPKRTTPLVRTDTKTASARRTLSTQLPLLGRTPTKKKRFSPFVIGLLGVATLGFLEILVIVRDLNFTSDNGATSFPTTSDVASPSSITNSPKGASAYYNQGDAYSKLGDYEGAIDKYTKAIGVNPNDAKAYVNRGKAHYEIAQHSGDPDKDFRAAIDDFNRALIFNPQAAEAYLKRGCPL